MTTIPVPTSADIAAAVERCTPLLRRTPVLATTPGDLGLSVSVTLKLESLQHAGSINALNIHPENAPLTVAAQATLGVELLEQVPDVDTVLGAVGGGGTRRRPPPGTPLVGASRCGRNGGVQGVSRRHRRP